MLPTLNGRIQLRILVTAVIGGLWTAIIAPLLPVGGASTALAYRSAFVVLGVLILLGIGWELIYHLLMQFRWEKDWPTFFGLLTGINEGVVLWLVMRFALPGFLPPPAAFAVQFVTTWILVWLVLNGPLRAIFLRQRFRGGRFV
ncbi:MAG: hypothetical protein QM809_06620 [Gordonia sp. (in: high G+C Gram-positive bacteria)]|uniref:hypothetical protein n=1 Tax=Gordonia sp. (in: high G+C Gram-positive bacteria) TaxID=84139 RepID=UPI0039E4A39A